MNDSEDILDVTPLVSKSLALYQRIAIDFFQNYHNASSLLKDLLEQGEKEEARDLLETIAIIARDLGAKELVDRSSMLSLAIENSIGNDTRQWNAALKNFSDTLAAFFAAMEICNCNESL